MIKREENNEEKLKILLKLPPSVNIVTDEVDEEEIVNLVNNENTILDDLNNNKEFNNPEYLNLKQKIIFGK